MKRKKSGSVYCLTPPELRGTDRVKIGFTNTDTAEFRRIKSYGNESQVHHNISVDDPILVEKLLKESFSQKFTSIKNGNEFYEGNIKEIKIEFTKVVYDYFIKNKSNIHETQTHDAQIHETQIHETQIHESKENQVNKLKSKSKRVRENENIKCVLKFLKNFISLTHYISAEDENYTEWIKTYDLYNIFREFQRDNHDVIKYISAPTSFGKIISSVKDYSLSVIRVKIPGNTKHYSFHISEIKELYTCVTEYEISKIFINIIDAVIIMKNIEKDCNERTSKNEIYAFTNNKNMNISVNDLIKFLTNIPNVSYDKNTTKKVNNDTHRGVFIGFKIIQQNPYD